MFNKHRIMHSMSKGFMEQLQQDFTDFMQKAVKTDFKKSAKSYISEIE